MSVLACSAAGAGYAAATAADGAHQIHACASQKTGVLRLANRCRRAERTVMWDRTVAGSSVPVRAYYASRSTSPTDRVSVRVPPGDYVATGGCTARATAPEGQASPQFSYAQSVLSTGALVGKPAAKFFLSEASVPDTGQLLDTPPSPTFYGSSALSTSGGFALPNGGTITEACARDEPLNNIETDFSALSLVVTRVDQLNQQ